MKIRAIVMDVDGTLTDGGIYTGDNGESFKRFNVKDGLAIKHKLPQLGIIPIVLTGRQSDIVESRCKELNINYIKQNSVNKVRDLEELLNAIGCSFAEVAYIGDDINDLECMKLVSFRGCPADAIREIKEVSDFVSSLNGGYGAVREFIDWIEKNEKNNYSEWNK